MQSPELVMPVATWRKKCALRMVNKKKKVDVTEYFDGSIVGWRWLRRKVLISVTW